jgi:hypothetical protein
LSFKKRDTPKFKAFSSKKDSKRRKVKDFRLEILQKSWTDLLKSTQIDSLPEAYSGEKKTFKILIYSIC